MATKPKETPMRRKKKTVPAETTTVAVEEKPTTLIARYKRTPKWRAVEKHEAKALAKLNIETMSDAIAAAIGRQAILATLQPGNLSKDLSVLRSEVRSSGPGKALMTLARSEFGAQPAADVLKSRPAEYSEALQVFDVWAG